MNTTLVRVGLVVARPDASLADLEEHIGASGIDLLLLPEGYLNNGNLEKAQEIVNGSGKWVVTSVSDKTNPDRWLEVGVAIAPNGDIVGRHAKTSITRYEIERGYSRGDDISAIDTEFGRIGIPVCYEIHLPEVARIMALAGARILFNPIGTGMWNEEQLATWTAIARSRAYENGAFVVGCSHYNDTIPIAFAYAPGGIELVVTRDAQRLVPVVLDFDRYGHRGHFEERRPDLYGPLSVPPTSGASTP